MIGVALGAAYEGRDFFALLVAAASVAMFWEWRQLTKSWGMNWAVAGFIYAALPAIALIWIRLVEPANEFPKLLLWAFIVTWATDIGAYFVGKAIGRNKLAPSISPGKTIEGLVGGVIIAALLGGAWVWDQHLGRALFVAAPLFALAAQAGDLFESVVKRRFNAKDASQLIPGHGGLMDRLDGFVAAVVVAAVVGLVRGGVNAPAHGLMVW